MTQTQNPKRIIYRQGDVILEQVDFNMKDLEYYAKLDGERLEIRSETGNTHVLSNVKVYRYYNQQLVVVEKPTPITHPQHPTLIIEPGIYTVRFVRDWMLRESRPYD
jgi:hypothetical protein